MMPIETQRVRAGWTVALAAIATIGCGGSEPSQQAATAEPPPADMPQTSGQEDPSETSTGEELGQLQTVETGEASEHPRPSPESQPRTSARAIDETGFSTPNAPAIRLSRGEFRGRGFKIAPIPRGVTFHRVDAEPPTWEVRERGGRVALIQEAPWSQVAGGQGGARVSPRTSSGQPMDVGDWGGRASRIVIEQFSSEAYVYRIERLADGSDWITAGWEPLE